MEVRLVVCAFVLVAVMVTGSNAQLDVCGVPTVRTRIVGDQNATAGSWPWQVSLQILDHLVCGGSLISKQWVLTSAQCHVPGVTHPFDYKVYLGRDSLNVPSPNEQVRSVSKIIRHPKFDRIYLDNDIALVELSFPVTFTDYIRPVCLSADNNDFNPGESCWITGWGQYKTGVQLPNPQRLQQVRVPIVSNSDCNKAYGVVPYNLICTSAAGGEGTCASDVGGPLVKESGSKWVQGGVVSLMCTIDCARPGVPSSYARVSRYESWIKSQTTLNPPGFIYSGVSQLSAPLLLSISLVLSSLFVLS